MSAQLLGNGQFVAQAERLARRDDVIVGHWLTESGTMAAHAPGAPCELCDRPAARQRPAEPRPSGLRPSGTGRRGRRRRRPGRTARRFWSATADVATFLTALADGVGGRSA